jgi:hypothetical protein
VEKKGGPEGRKNRRDEWEMALERRSGQEEGKKRAFGMLISQASNIEALGEVLPTTDSSCL